jgi:NADH-quinone oxidoreductase subunit J
MFFNYVWFGGMALILIITAVGMLISRNAIYSALCLVLNFSVVAILYLSLGAPFLALAQVTVYAGAIMVLFLFVIMLLGAERLSGKEPIKFHRVLGILLAVILLAEVVVLIVWQMGGTAGGMAILGEAAADYGSPDKIGRELFTTYALPFEITSVILLAAAVGAITLTKGEGVVSIRQVLLSGRRREIVEQQSPAEEKETGG